MYRLVSIQKSNLYRNIRQVKVYHVEGFEKVILDPNSLFMARTAKAVTVSLKPFYHMAE